MVLILKVKSYFCAVKIHEKYMQRCLQIAKNGMVAALPNPSVGAVIVYDDSIIGEGFTSPYGGPHAEVNAINAVKDKSLLKNSTLYVSLEPCSHFGKTPPCCDLIIKHEIPTIIIGAVDPNTLVSGKSIDKLREAGKQVEVGILEKECQDSNRRFFTFHSKKRPYIILKWAESLDGFIAPSKEIRVDKNELERKPFWISNIYSRQLTHQWRSEEQAILIGTQTAIDDNPKLDVRDWYGKNPVKIVLDQKNRIPKENYIFDNRTNTMVITAGDLDFKKEIGQQITRILFDKNIASVIIEGGRKTLQSFIDENLWDEARIFRGTIVLNSGIKAPELRGKLIAKKAIMDDELLIITNHD
jgi:diaminohydroxyphosphoribosylaminopyrimidine deaminase/5-amino-6-(5-phosphoribosylamino)uracil reductase